MKTNRTILSAAFIFTGAYTCLASGISVEEALKKGFVKMHIAGSGGHTGSVIRMKIDNLTARPLELKVEAGRRIDSKDSTEQDLLITKTELFTLGPRQSKKLKLNGMCCQAHHSSPDSGDGFLVGKMADSNLIKLASYIDKNHWYTESSAQEAVWVLSDNNPMESISGDDATGKALQQFVSKLTGRALPKYAIRYKETDGTTAFSNKALEISGMFEYDLFSNGVVTFGIYDKDNKLVEIFFAERLQNKGHYSFKYSYSATGLPSGSYYAKLRVDGQLRKEMKFEF